MGFGICEDTGMIAPGAGAPLRVFGGQGMVVCQLDPEQTEVQDDIFTAKGVRLWLVRPGESFLPTTGVVTGAPTADPGFALRDLLERMAEECGGLLREDPHVIGHAHVRVTLIEGGSTRAVINVESTRSEY